MSQFLQPFPVLKQSIYTRQKIIWIQKSNFTFQQPICQGNRGTLPSSSPELIWTQGEINSEV